MGSIKYYLIVILLCLSACEPAHAASVVSSGTFQSYTGLHKTDTRSVSGSLPIVSSGGTTPSISLASVPFGNISTAQRGKYAFQSTTVNSQPLSGNVVVTTISGNAGTASALAALPSACGAGQSPLGILANGNATGCFTPTGTYSLPTATASVLGGVKPDGTSIINSAGVISVTTASIGATANTAPTSWTPTGNGITFTSASGYYTVAGNTVTVVFNVTWPATANASAAEIANLPITMGAYGSTVYSGQIGSSTAATPIHIYGTQGTAFLVVNATASGVVQTNANMTGAVVSGSITYLK